MAKAALDGFRRNEWVKNIDDLPRVPAGTKGRVYLVDGFAWTRYRVLFDNGVDIGSLDAAVLARPATSLRPWSGASRQRLPPRRPVKRPRWPTRRALRPPTRTRP